MSVNKIVAETINKNPLAVKEALEDEMKARIRLALESIINEEEMDDEDDMEDDMEDDEEEDEDDMEDDE